MRKVARYVLFAIVAGIVGSAMVFVWAMQREYDVSTPDARAEQVEAMVLGCKLRLPEVLKKSDVAIEPSPDQMKEICSCAVNGIIDTYAVSGKIRPSDVTESAIDAAELDCLRKATAQ